MVTFAETMTTLRSFMDVYGDITCVLIDHKGERFDTLYERKISEFLDEYEELGKQDELDDRPFVYPIPFKVPVVIDKAVYDEKNSWVAFSIDGMEMIKGSVQWREGTPLAEKQGGE